MLIGGIVGAVIIPLISDSRRRRKPFVLLALAGLLPGLAGLTFAASYWLLLVSSFVFGFFLLSAGPIGFQYGAEMTLPAPEGTSNSMLVVMGQVSGILFIIAMDALKAPDGSMTVSLAILCRAHGGELRAGPLPEGVTDRQGVREAPACTGSCRG